MIVESILKLPRFARSQEEGKDEEGRGGGGGGRDSPLAKGKVQLRRQPLQLPEQSSVEFMAKIPSYEAIAFNPGKLCSIPSFSSFSCSCDSEEK